MTARHWAAIFIMMAIIFGGPVQAQTSDSIIPAGQEEYFKSAPLITPEDKPIRLFLDHSEFSLQSIPFINAQGQILISVDDAARLFSCLVDFVDSNQVILSNDQLQLSFRINENTCIKNNALCCLDTAPEMREGTFMLPLSFIAGQLGYQFYYQADFNQITLFSPTEQSRRENISIPPVETTEPAVSPPENLAPWGSLLSAPALGAGWQDQTLLGGYYTSLKNSPPGRNTNIALSCNRINEMVLKPGEVFSFNQAVGERTSQAGYQSAKIFVGDNIVSGIGGGVCQTASTLYNCALETGMQVVERHPHSLKVAYVPAERDATVAWGGADFKFCNRQSFPVKILIRINGEYLTAAIAAVR